MDLSVLTKVIMGPGAIVTAVCFVVTTYLLQAIYRLYRVRTFYRNKPGPPHSFLWGHLKVIGEIAAKMPPNMHPQALYTEIARVYDLEDIFYLDLWPVGPPSVVLSNPELSDQVSVAERLPQHTVAEEFVSRIVGPNVIATVNGPIWKKLHTAMSPAFSWSHIRSLTDLIVDECQLFRKALDEKARTGEVFSFEDLGAKLIFDVIARVVFNVPLNAQTSGSSYFDDLRELVHFADAQTDITLMLNPIKQLKNKWRKHKILRRLNPSIMAKINERLALLRSESVVPSRKDPNSILDLMLREYAQASKEGKQIFDKNGELPPAEAELLLTNIKGLLLGGHGTTNDTLCYIYMLLSKAPHVVDKIRQEHDTVFGPSIDLTFEKLVEAPELLQSLPYTDAVIKETLRLFPVGFGSKEAGPGASLTYKGETMPIDNHLAISVNALDIHYNEKYFPSPQEFTPERWLDPDNEIPRSYFRTFGRGHRACLGQNMATNELKIILVATIREYDFQCAGLEPNAQPKTLHTGLDTIYGDIIFQELGMEAKPRGGMMMTVKKREL
ncbi:Cytochrome P450 monooxygenase acrF-like protein [Cladobotryum mycophilum]|uniref:Cytochrome P450 monooxygenase acrF-like protein n=1 Tax=Cladobotryum mycophilum TaxID=491253 RepID=A0ABR0T1N7_9HYPO